MSHCATHLRTANRFRPTGKCGACDACWTETITLVGDRFADSQPERNSGSGLTRRERAGGGSRYSSCCDRVGDMRYPARLAHLATRAVLASKLAPTYAMAHEVDEEEAVQRLALALRGRLFEDLLAAAWAAMTARHPRLDEAKLLEKVATTLRDRPQRPGRRAKLNPAWSAFLIWVDLEAGVASDSAGRVLETEQGRAMTASGLAQAGQHLALELTRGP